MAELLVKDISPELRKALKLMAIDRMHSGQKGE